MHKELAISLLSSIKSETLYCHSLSPKAAPALFFSTSGCPMPSLCLPSHHLTIHSKYWDEHNFREEGGTGIAIPAKTVMISLIIMEEKLMHELCVFLNYIAHHHFRMLAESSTSTSFESKGEQGS